jgi:hypothetical protein
MMTRCALLILCALLAGCVDDLPGCQQAHGLWDGTHCSAR